jgi:hypothetical protein
MNLRLSLQGAHDRLVMLPGTPIKAQCILKEVKINLLHIAFEKLNRALVRFTLAVSLDPSESC